MKKIIATSVFFASCAVNAGGMGPIVAPSWHAFISAEGGYTWNQIGELELVFPSLGGSIDSRLNNQGGSARVATGIIHPVNDLFFISGEIGWGYYGNTKSTPFIEGTLDSIIPDPTSLDGALNMKTTLYGFDILAGAIYNQPKFDLFFKAGALIQNAQTTASLDTAGLGGFVALHANIKTNQTQAMPEIKLGGSYHVTDRFSILASWSHAFGATRKGTGDLGDGLSFSNLGRYTLNAQNPTIDVVLAGLQYNFA